jgi:hypothetical protein
MRKTRTPTIATAHGWRIAGKMDGVVVQAAGTRRNTTNEKAMVSMPELPGHVSGALQMRLRDPEAHREDVAGQKSGGASGV